MKIDLIYLNESKRIRKEYLNNLSYIVKREDEIQDFIVEIQKVQTDIRETQTTDERYFQEKLLLINENIDKLKSYITIYYEKIKQLDKDQRILYDNIKVTYPDLKDDDLKNQIIECVKPIDEEFRIKNVDLFEKLAKRE